MPLAPEISVAPASTAPYSLTVAGADVLVPGSGGNQPGAPLETVSITELGPGGVSSMVFTYEDPTGATRMPVDGDEVQMWDRTNNVPLFGGFVSSWDVQPDFGGQGRSIDLRCDGYEAILDWALLTADLVVPALIELQAAIQLCAAAAEGTPGLRTFGAIAGSNQAQPVGHFGAVPATTLYAVTIPAGTSLRRALDTVGHAAANRAAKSFDLVPSNVVFTVDFYRGLRAMQDSAAGSWAGDYADLTVDDGSSANRAEGLRHRTDAASIVRGIYIKGASAAGSGLLMDGSGKPGRIAYMEDATIDTAAKLADALATYLNTYIIGIRGGFSLTDWTPPSAAIHPGSLLTLTDAATGASGIYRIYSIAKTFTAARQNWRIGYGGLPPRATTLLRRLTRNIRS